MNWSAWLGRLLKAKAATVRNAMHSELVGMAGNRRVTLHMPSGSCYPVRSVLKTDCYFAVSSIRD